MIGPDVRREFERWREMKVRYCRGCDRLSSLAVEHTCCPLLYVEAYPLWNGFHRRWYMRERMPGGRVWRLEESESEGFSFAEVKST